MKGIKSKRLFVVLRPSLSFARSPCLCSFSLFVSLVSLSLSLSFSLSLFLCGSFSRSVSRCLLVSLGRGRAREREREKAREREEQEEKKQSQLGQHISHRGHVNTTQFQTHIQIDQKVGRPETTVKHRVREWSAAGGIFGVQVLQSSRRGCQTATSKRKVGKAMARGAEGVSRTHVVLRREECARRQLRSTVQGLARTRGVEGCQRQL